MIHPARLSRSALASALIAAVGMGCHHPPAAEVATGRGPGAGAPAPREPIRLGLQQFNGCEILANGQPVAKGAANIPYPEQCPSMNAEDLAPVKPTAAMRLVLGTPYVLHQLTLMDTVVNAHTDFKDLEAPARWMRTQSRFKDLDWSQLKVTLDEWLPSNLTSWSREVFFGDAAWMQVKDDTFQLEVLDASGQVRQAVTYSHEDFWAESPVAGHSRISWRVEPVQPPRAPGDLTLDTSQGSPSFHTSVRIDLVGAREPSKSFKVEGPAGDGAIRITWSLLPGHPFYFPVTFVAPGDIPATCFGGPDGAKLVPCGYGLDPQLHLSTPEGGKGYYRPGETFNLLFALKDGEGNRLHPRDTLPDYPSFFSGDANGLLYYNPGHVQNLQEADSLIAFKVLGPVQDLLPPPDKMKPGPYFQFYPQRDGEAAEGLVVVNIAADNVIPGLRNVSWPTRVPVTLPADARPGTYVALLKTHRQFMGERLSRTRAVLFQVGQPTPTTYPVRLGNCQACHNGPVALENLRHGLSFEHIEACKGCHANVVADWGREVHALHARSARYLLDKADCSVCHLTRESALRPTYELCSSCHPTLHGDKYFQTEFTLSGPSSRYATCAQGCHVDKLPKGHILPAQ